MNPPRRIHANLPKGHELVDFRPTKAELMTLGYHYLERYFAVQETFAMGCSGSWEIREAPFAWRRFNAIAEALSPGKPIEEFQQHIDQRWAEIEELRREVESEAGDCAHESEAKKDQAASDDDQTVGSDAGKTAALQSGSTAFSPTKGVLDEVADEIRRTAICCHEALRDYWERNDEGFEAMRDGLERVLRLLGYPMPDYDRRDREWEEDNRPWKDAEPDV